MTISLMQMQRLCTVHIKILRVAEQKRKLISRKKIKGFKSVNEHSNSVFTSPASTKNVQHMSSAEQVTVCDHSCESDSSASLQTEEGGANTIQTCVGLENCRETLTVTNTIETQTEHEDVNDGDIKQWNFNKYLICQQQKRLTKIKYIIKKQTSKNELLQQRHGHYSIKNVNKRDETAKQNKIQLRKTLSENKNLCRRLRLVNDKLTQQRNNVRRLTKEQIDSSQQIVNLQKLLDSERAKKVSAQKSNSKLRNKVAFLKGKISSFKAEGNDKCLSIKNMEKNEKIKQVTNLLCEKDVQLSELTEELNELQASQRKVETRSAKGAFASNVRECVIQLAGLEVATEKVTPVIEVVAETLFDHKFVSRELPNASTVQTIIDEGHFLAKTFIATKIDKCNNWGLHRDGTSRKRKKIIDTSVTLDSGEVMSLGFTSVSSETAASITNVTQTHLSELSELHGAVNQIVDQDYIITSLKKLSFTMSDRAANEKLANKLLNNWRTELLGQCEHENDVASVKNFHCMAHVLLAFHKYACDEIKLFEKGLIEEVGPIGRDSLPRFKSWRKTGTVVERVVRTTSDSFGPGGSYLGLRDKWEAYCATKGVKSRIGNYKDNRFNCLFETEAQIVVHHADFLHVLNTASTLNQKLVSVKADLETPSVMVMLSCLALIFVRVTGPFWNLIVSGTVTYLDVHQHVQKLHAYLHRCAVNPQNIDNDWIDEEHIVVHEDLYLQALNNTDMESPVFICMMKSICSGMLKAVEKQMADFLPNGLFGETPDASTVKSTAFAPLTNLSCEHHFGDLDSSQRRRPNASFHHHSSVQLLKRNRRQLSEWLSGMDEQEKENLWLSARKGGKQLRLKHQAQDRRVHEEIVSLMNSNKKQKTSIDIPDCEEDCDEEEFDNTDQNQLSSLLPDVNSVKVNDYVIIAYQDRWYPGCVNALKEDDQICVNFMTASRQAGVFVWPIRDDKQTVEKKFILDLRTAPECINSGQQWFFPNYEHYKKLFNQYKKLFF
ncbi:uncharacterized protein LOC127832644 [Dreissena polymorpha]|uniref:Uncharacterized protein n=1 Tax=Dreissena polymorpha TaxID=45954 RepID=A0A9D4H065_DREPO|nr:uncharacterized protein LOC127832644 [Dreissena polymorpha]KAH3826899.1 hypothetical protein DPMN_128826 [Dreissena polymorpha]